MSNEEKQPICYVSDELNADLRYEFEEDVKQVRERNWVDIDEDIVPHIKELNEVEGVITRYCCSSHPEKREYRLYIMMAYTEKCRVFLEKILMYMYNKEPKACERTQLEITTTYSGHLIFKEKGISGRKLPPIYKSITIDMNLIKPKLRLKMNKLLLEAIREVRKENG